MTAPLNRIRHQYNENYTTIDNAARNAMIEGAISCEAFGLFVYMWSLPPDWKFFQKTIEEATGMGREKTRRCVSELEAAGFLSRTKMPPHEGNGYDWCLDDRGDGFPDTSREDGFAESSLNPHLLIPEGKGKGRGNSNRRGKQETPESIQKTERPREQCGKPDSFDEVRQYASEIGLPLLETEKFYDHFEANGWRQGGRSRLKDWRAALRNWKRMVPEFSRSNGRQPEFDGILRRARINA